MLLLCLDTATPQVGVAIGSDDQVIGRVQLARPQHHAEHLAPAIAYLMEQLDLSLDQLSGIGVGIGPGLFTGLRVGVTTAKVMAQALRIPLIAVPSLDLSLDQLSGIGVGIGPGLFTGLRVGVTTAKVMAQALRIPLIAVPSLDLLAFEVRYTDRLVVPALDAKRGEVFYATYRQVPGGVQRLSDYEVASPADLCAELMSRSEEVLLLGDGAIRYRDDFFNLERVEFGPAALSYPSVSALVELTRAKFQREDFAHPRDVHPLYLRLSDAEMNWVKQAR